LPILLVVLSARAQDLRSDTIAVDQYTMHLDFTDFTPKILYANVVVGIKAKMNNVSTIRLDLLELTVDSVQVNAQSNSFRYNDSTLTIPFTPLNTGDSATLQIWYHGHPHQQLGDFGGFFWDQYYAFNIGVSFYNNPPNYGRVWFPCFDNFQSRSYFEYYVTTQRTQKAFCNGLLLDSSSTPSTNTWHWKLEGDIPSYLASVSISDYLTQFDTVQSITGAILPIQLGVRSVDTTAFNVTFRHLHNAFHIHEGHWGYYRWDRVGFCIVDFTRGAMEHTTNISFMDEFLYFYPNGEEFMAHELSHHWFGDLVTCNSASEMWLNEGWATYNQKLFLQSMYGDSTYDEQIRLNHQMVLDQAAVNDGSYLPVSGVPFAATYGTTVYYKGADMIHTLRYYMGDSLFFHCLQGYLTDFSYQTVTTADMSSYLSQCSGINLSDYFNDWISQPGFPHFSIERTQVNPSGNGYNVQLVIRQRLCHALQYYTNVPVMVSYFDINGNRTDEVVNVNGPCTSHTSQTMATEPVYVALDFDQKLQDAITDEWRTVTDTGALNFGTAEMTMEVDSATGTNLIRVEHNWVRPEPMANKIPGLHLHNTRYWTVDGIIHPGFTATATISYDKNDPTLDKTFITNSEDSLVMMYRANADSEWVMVDSFSVDTGVSSTDGSGSITIYNVQRGQYTMAIWNSSVPDSTTPDAPCIYSTLGITDVSKDNYGFTLFPNPASKGVTVGFNPNKFEKLEWATVLGVKIQEQRITPDQTSVELSLDKLAPGYYFITLTATDGTRSTKQLIKE